MDWIANRVAPRRRPPLGVKRAWAAVTVVAMAIAGCGSPAMTTNTYTCTPKCPAGTLCTANGCIGDILDLSASGGPDMAIPCGGSCKGDAPYCQEGACVPCLMDSHCPAGNLCKVAGAITVCVPGCKDDARCQAGGNTALRCCTGQCVDSSADAQNCGACGTACMSTHAGAACVSGECAAGTCDAGYADCDKDPTNGCEIYTRADAVNCGACGTICKFSHAKAGCSGGCYIAACDFGWDDCDGNPDNGCEVSVLADARNCGGCGLGCGVVAHAKNACVNGACQLASCDMGFADCDGNAKNGCEVNVFTDLGNCGQCGNGCGNGNLCKNGACTCPQCSYANAKSSCVNLQCQMGSCLPGYGDCNNSDKDGCEVVVANDPNNCGACGNVCPMQSAYCNDGVCTDNPCTGQVGGPILAAMGAPAYGGYCWYLSKGGETCDNVCAAAGGVNKANDALNWFQNEDCGGGGPEDQQPVTWFLNHGNACGFTMPNGAATGYKTLGHGYNNMDLAGRQPVYIGKCSQGCGGCLANLGTFPNETNDSTGTGNSRCVVCACDH